MQKLHILKLKDREDIWSDAQYYTIAGLRDRVLTDWYDIWSEEREQDYTKEQVAQSDEDMFEWLNGWGYDIETILTVTLNDFNQLQSKTV